MIGETIFASVFLGIIGFLICRSGFSAQRSTRIYVDNE